MTGSIHQYNRQHSSTVDSSSMTKSDLLKVRRSSSVEDNNSMDLVADVNQAKDILCSKREYRTSDVDSGTEETEQGLITTFNEHEDELSLKSFGPNPDEGFSEYEHEQESKLPLIENDLELAKRIPDDTKKDFCADTSVAFHGEFARLISVPLSLHHDIRYYLFSQEELDDDSYMKLKIQYMKLDNAKVQFKCQNCSHAWTSARARISFAITGPETGFIILKILGQNCTFCGTNSDALWYIDEVCRVMKNLAEVFYKEYFPDMLAHVDLKVEKQIKNDINQSRHRNYDPTQRKGKMFAPHVKQLCEACRAGLCFA